MYVGAVLRRPGVKVGPASPGAAWWLAAAIALAFFISVPAARAAILWSDPEATLIYNSGPGRDILHGALKRDDSSKDTLYFKFHVSPLSDYTTEEYYAAFELFEGEVERLGVGNAKEAYGYSAFFNTDESSDAHAPASYVDLRSSNLDPSPPGAAPNYEFPRRGAERTIVFKVQYVAGGDDLVTVWLNPDLSAGATEVRQPETLTTRFSANASFDEIRLRHGGGGEGWLFSDLAIATSFTDFVDPSSARARASDSTSLFTLQRFQFETWSREPGMPRSLIRALAQTSDGYLWAAGEDHLARFDGVRFVPLDLPHGSTVQTLFGDSQGALWIGTAANGLARYAGGQFDILTTRDGLPTNSITAIAEDNAGTLWIGTTAGLVTCKHGRVEKLNSLAPLEGHCIKALFADSAGVLWIAAQGEGVFSCRQRVLTRLSDADVESLLRDAQSLLVDNGGRVWVSAGEDLVLSRERGSWHRYRIPRQPGSRGVRALASEPDGTLWAGSASEGLFQFKEGRLASLNSSGSLSDAQACSLLIDRDANLWVGGGSGLHLLRRRHGFLLGHAEGLGRGVPGEVAEVAPGVVWVVQPGSGLYRWEGAAFRRLTASGLASVDAALGPMLVTRAGACWIACTNGLLLVRDPQAVADEALLFELQNAAISSLAEDADGSIWAGTRQGQLWRLEHGQWRLHCVLASGVAISALAADSEGLVWAGTDGAGLYWVGNSVRGHFSHSNGLHSDSVRALLRDLQGTLWVGTDGGGLTGLSNQVCATFTTANGLPDNSIHAILEDAAGRLWLNDGSGLTCIQRPSLPAKTVEVLSTYPLAGSRTEDSGSLNSSTRLFPRGCNTRLGRLWFPMADGIFVADPAGVANHVQNPAVLLEQVLVDGTPAPGFKPIEAPPFGSPVQSPLPPALRIGPGKHRVQLHYTCPCFGEAEKLRFRYRMEGLDPDWVEAGTARAAQYNYLPPGEYHFTVAVGGPSSPSSQAGLDIQVSPYFWQRGWVICAGAGGLLALVGGGARVVENRRMKQRLRRLEQQNALERERTRIAQDLHDEMGAKLCRISFVSEHASRLDPSSGELKEQVGSIAEDSRKLLCSLDEIVWVVNPKNDTLEHAASYVAQYAQEYFQGTGVECELHISPDLPDVPLSSQTRHHLFLAVQEALTNVLKHSGARRVKIAVSCTGQTLTVEVNDDGKGLALPAPLAKSQPSEDAGNGLRNMRQRIKALGGVCRLDSAPGHGTTVQFVLPLNPP